MTRYLNKNHQTESNELLAGILADTYILYFKTHAFHWNVEGVHFKQFHDMFEEQYTELWNATDILAERIRALGGYGPTNFANLVKPAELKGDDGKKKSAEAMVEALVADHEKIAERISAAIDKCSEFGDEVTTDILVARLTKHDQYAWMLKATAK